MNQTLDKLTVCTACIFTNGMGFKGSEDFKNSSRNREIHTNFMYCITICSFNYQCEGLAFTLIQSYKPYIFNFVKNTFPLLQIYSATYV
jgi:hypothetical protein